MTRRWAAGLALGALAALSVLAPAEEPGSLVRALDQTDEAARKAAVDALEKSPDRDNLVVTALRDPETRGRLGPSALASLADLASAHDLRFANAGLRALVGDAAVALPVRKAAARALAKTGSVADVSALGDAVRDLPDEASRALVAIGGAAAQNALRRGAGDDPPLEATAGLALLGDESMLERLVSSLGKGESRAAALLAWATGRDLGASADVWNAHLRQRVLAARLSDLDNEKAGDAIDVMAASLRGSGAATLADDLAGVLKDEKYPAFARNKAALALGLGGVRAAQDALVWACRDGEVGSVRMYAGDALARVGDLSCAPALLRWLTFDEDKDRLSAKRGVENDFFPVDPCFVRALFRMGVRGATDRLIEVCAGEYRTRLHRDCLRALDEVSGGRDFAFEPDSSKTERKAAVERMRAWWREGRESVAIAPRADDPGWPAFRKAVDEQIEILGGFKFLYQMRAKMILVCLAEPALPQLTAALSHANDHVRMGVADVLGTSTLRDAAVPLAARLAGEGNPAVRSRILVALEVCGRPRADGKAVAPEVADAVRRALDDKSFDVRIGAARTLGVVGDLAADLPRLTAAKAEARNADDAFRFTASAAILRLSFRAAVPDLVAQLRSEDVALRSEAAKALAAGGIDLHGFDTDAPPEARDAAIRRILETAPGSLSTVPYRERK